MELPVSFKTAALGGKVQVPGIDDTFSYTIPECTQSGKMFCVRGKGVKTNGASGDLYITVVVEVPKGLSREQRAKLDEFDSAVDKKQCAKMKAYQDNVSALYGVDPYK